MERDTLSRHSKICVAVRGVYLHVEMCMANKMNIIINYTYCEIIGNN